MHGIVIQYTYSGDEKVWQDAVDAFIAAVDADAAIAGKFHYLVTVGKDGVSRTHVGQWDEPATVKAMQAQDYFATFSGALKALAGDTLTTGLMDVYNSTA